VHLYCTDTNTVSKQSETRFHTIHSPRSSIGCVQDDFRGYGTFGTNRAPILRQDWHYLETDLNKLSLKPRHLGVSSGASKTISQPMVRSARTAHLVKICTISNQTKTSFHLSLVTLRFQQVRPIQFPSPWYVQWKPCTYIAPTLTLSPNGLKQDST
jgi:hypothetical protein